MYYCKAMAKKYMPPLPLIGRREKVSFPSLGLSGVTAKIDTGAYSASLHARILSLEEHSEGTLVVFQPLGKKNKLRNILPVTLPVLRMKKVKSSNGQAQSRIFVSIPLQIGPYLVETAFGLTDRSAMKTTVLLGRKILSQRFLVDVSRSHLLVPKAKKRQKKTGS